LKNAPSEYNTELLKDIWGSNKINISDFETLYSMYPSGMKVNKLFFLNALADIKCDKYGE
jgi:hypothetical protein